MPTQTALPITDLAKPPEQPLIVQSNPLTIIERAIDRGCDPDQLEKLLALQERWEKNEAAKRFAESISTFQAKCPEILKKREAVIKTKGGGEYSYQYAAFEDVMHDIKPLLAENGIGIDFSTDTDGERIKITCRLRVGTHVEDKTLTVPVPAMNVNDTQRYGAALSYAKRYALCAALNIVVAGEDSDAAVEEANELVTSAMCSELEHIVTQRGWKLENLLTWAKVTSLEEMSVKQYREAKAMMRKK